MAHFRLSAQLPQWPSCATTGCRSPDFSAWSVLPCTAEHIFVCRTLRCSLKLVLTVSPLSRLQGQVCALQKGHNCATLMSTPCMTWWPAPGAANGVMCSDCRTKFGESDIKAQRRMLCCLWGSGVSIGEL
jgi:hypothetical protein